MPTRARRTCSRCRRVLTAPGKCPTCASRDPQPTNYGGAGWRKARADFLAANPTCVQCGNPSKVADHYPISRRNLIGRYKVSDPDAPHRLRALCVPCHNAASSRQREDRDAPPWGG